MSTYDVLAWVWEIVHPRRVRVCADVIHGSRRWRLPAALPARDGRQGFYYKWRRFSFAHGRVDATSAVAFGLVVVVVVADLPRPQRVSVFFESLWARKTAWATNLPFDGVVPLSWHRRIRE